MPIRPAGYWHETVDLSPPRPSLESTVETDVTIIGGGYCGLSTALALKRAQQRVAQVAESGSALPA